MKNNWKDFVQFTSSERRGIIILSIIAIICASYSYFAPKWVSKRQIAIFERKYAEALQKARDYNDSLAFISEIQNENLNYNISFDQNPIDSTASLNIEAKTTFETKPLELNTVTAQQLIKRVGLEAELAFRIIKFRDGLGGFYAQTQLKEVFGVTDNDYQNLITQVEFNVHATKKININKATLEELQAHSYISPKLAQQIINYREKVKPFATPEDVLKLYMVDEVLHKKMMPYVQL